MKIDPRGGFFKILKYKKYTWFEVNSKLQTLGHKRTHTLFEKRRNSRSRCCGTSSLVDWVNSELDKSVIMALVGSPAQLQMSLFLEYPFP